MTQLLRCLPSMHDALGSIPSTKYLVSSKAGVIHALQSQHSGGRNRKIGSSRLTSLECTRTRKEGGGEGRE